MANVAVPLPVHDLQARLNFVAKLSFLDRVSCLLAALACAALTAKLIVLSPHFPFPVPSFLPPALAPYLRLLPLAIAAFLGGQIAAYFCAERYYKALEVSPEFAAYEDSMFADIDGVRTHYQAEDASLASQGAAAAAPSYGVQLWHGFGANTSSWSLVIKGLATTLQASVAAHDKPGFGLTHRPLRLAAYSAAFNGILGRRILELRLQQATVGRQFAADIGALLSQDPAAPAPAAAPVPAPGLVFCGHSLGALSAALETVRDPRGVTHLILVSPAIMVLPSRFQPPAFLMPLVGLARYLAGLAIVVFSPLILFILRKVVRNRAFWVQGLRAARYQPAGLTDALLDGYRRPGVVRDWDYGLVRFLRSRLSGYTGSPIAAMVNAGAAEDSAIVEKLAAVVKAQGIQVLIIHGKADRIVPLSNSVALCKALGGEARCAVKVLEDVGHVAMEEVPDEFIRIVKEFVEKK